MGRRDRLTVTAPPPAALRPAGGHMDTNRNSRVVIFLGSFAAALAIGGGLTGCSDDEAGPAPPKDIVATASAAGTFNTLVAALGAADLTATLQSAGPFTVFAPTDA